MTTHVRPEMSPDPALDWIPTTCEMAELVKCHDWSSTSLGHPSTWPQALRNVVSQCLSTNFPILVLWGPDLVKIYNDGYRDMVGPSKHPRALGAPVAEIWPEIWETIGPMFDSVVATGQPTWSEHEELLIDRRGFTEECTFTFSYSPLFDDDGEINGVLDISVETTKEIVQARRLECIADLTAALAMHDQATDACMSAIATLRRHTLDIVSADVVLNIDGSLVPIASNRRSLHTAGRLYDTLGDVLDRQPRTIGQEQPEFPAEHRIVPMFGGGGEVAGVFVASLNPLRPFDAGYAQFIDVIAQTISASIERSQRRSEVVGELEFVNDTLQRAMLPVVRDTPTIAARYRPASNNLSVGGDWYDIIDLPDDRRALVVGDCVGHGLHAATAMGQLRSAARALLLERPDPARMISSLDAFVESIDGGTCASLVCVTVDHSSGEMSYCAAGHPPPLIVGPDGARWLDASHGPVLGVVPDVERTNSTTSLGSDDVLIMYTDGLVGLRHEPIDRQLGSLAEHAVSVADRDVTHIANSILVAMDIEHVDDDVVLLVKRLENPA